MEIIRYLRDGVTATIRFDYLTRTYFGELSGVPSAALMESSSYEEIQELLLAAMEEYLSGGDTVDAEDEWSQVVNLEEVRARKETEKPEPEPTLEDAETKEPAETTMTPVELRTIEQPAVADYEHRKYLLR